MSKQTFGNTAVLAAAIIIMSLMLHELKSRPPKSPCLEYGMPTHSIIHVDPDKSTLIYECKGWMK